MDARTDALQRRASATAGVIALGGGLPNPALFPRARFGRAVYEALHEPSARALQYDWPEGSPLLRETIARGLRARGADVRAEDVLVTSGAQQALAIAVELLFRPGDRVGVGDATYPGLLDVLRARWIDVTSDEGRPALDGVYVVPVIGNPRGRGLTEDGRRRILAAARASIPVIEDDAYADLRFGGPAGRPLLADARDAVYHVGTFSKTLSPGLRVGWLVPPRARREDALEAKRRLDLQTNGLAQAMLEAYFRRVDHDRHLSRARAFYARRAEQLVDACRRRLPELRFEEPEGGFSLFLESDLEVDDRDLLEAAIAHGVSFDPGSLFRAEPGAALSMRLTFSIEEPSLFDEGVSRLAEAIRGYRRLPRVARLSRSRRSDSSI